VETNTSATIAATVPSNLFRPVIVDDPSSHGSKTAPSESAIGLASEWLIGLSPVNVFHLGADELRDREEVNIDECAAHPRNGQLFVITQLLR
jgi:hypothetical protein